jgi:hypothetical protein
MIFIMLNKYNKSRQFRTRPDAQSRLVYSRSALELFHLLWFSRRSVACAFTFQVSLSNCSYVLYL